MSYPSPLYHGESGEVSAHVVRAGIEPAVVYPNGNKAFYLARDTQTSGTFGLEEGLAAGMGDLDEDAYDRFMREHDNTWV